MDPARWAGLTERPFQGRRPLPGSNATVSTSNRWSALRSDHRLISVILRDDWSTAERSQKIAGGRRPPESDGEKPSTPAGVAEPCNWEAGGACPEDIGGMHPANLVTAKVALESGQARQVVSTLPIMRAEPIESTAAVGRFCPNITISRFSLKVPMLPPSAGG